MKIKNVGEKIRAIKKEMSIIEAEIANMRGGVFTIGHHTYGLDYKTGRVDGLRLALEILAGRELPR